MGELTTHLFVECLCKWHASETIPKQKHHTNESLLRHNAYGNFHKFYHTSKALCRITPLAFRISLQIHAPSFGIIFKFISFNNNKFNRSNNIIDVYFCVTARVHVFNEIAIVCSFTNCLIFSCVINSIIYWKVAVRLCVHCNSDIFPRIAIGLIQF